MEKHFENKLSFIFEEAEIFAEKCLSGLISFSLLQSAIAPVSHPTPERTHSAFIMGTQPSSCCWKDHFPVAGTPSQMHLLSQGVLDDTAKAGRRSGMMER